jgi:hypothetical protein
MRAPTRTGVRIDPAKPQMPARSRCKNVSRGCVIQSPSNVSRIMEHLGRNLLHILRRVAK